MYLTCLGSRGSLPVAARPAGLPSKRLGCMGGLAQACCCSQPAAAHAGPRPMNEINAFESGNAPFVQTCGLSLIACSCQIAGLNPHASSRESFQLLDRSQGPQRRVRMQAAIMPCMTWLACKPSRKWASLITCFQEVVRGACRHGALLWYSAAPYKP